MNGGGGDEAIGHGEGATEGPAFCAKRAPEFTDLERRREDMAAIAQAELCVPGQEITFGAAVCQRINSVAVHERSYRPCTARE